MAVVATVCHIIRDNKLLLQKKSKGLFGEGKWNGVGGKLEMDENPEACVAREILEETGLKALNLKFHEVLNFYFGDRNELDWIVYVFSTKVFEGEPKSGGEGDLQWFAFKDIPYDEMWQDDKYWLPFLLEDKSFRGTFYFDEEGKELLGFDLKSEDVFT